MAEPDATQIIVGSGLLYVAPLGTTLPVTDAHGEYPLSWPAGWVLVGYTDAGIDIVYTPTIKEIMVDEETAPVADVLAAEKFHVASHLAEATLANLNRAIAASTLTDHSATLGDINVNAGSQALNYVMVGVSGPAPGTNKIRLLIMQKAIQTTAVAFKIQRKDKVVFPVQFDARKLSGKNLFDIWDLTVNAS